MITRSRVAAFFGFVLLIASALAVSYSQPQAEPVPTPLPIPCVKQNSLFDCSVFVGSDQYILAKGQTVGISRNAELLGLETSNSSTLTYVEAVRGDDKIMYVYVISGTFEIVHKEDILEVLCGFDPEHYEVQPPPDVRFECPAHG